jgi:hypothetical protein
MAMASMRSLIYDLLSRVAIAIQRGNVRGHYATPSITSATKFSSDARR